MCILRPTLIYGSDDPHNSYGPNRFVRDSKEKQSIYLFGKGEEKRDHVWVKDVAHIIYLCIVFSSCGIMNVVSGKVISFNEIAKSIIQLSKNKVDIINKRRIGLMPHGGYRAFNNKITNKYFSFKFNHFKTVLKAIYKEYR